MWLSESIPVGSRSPFFIGNQKKWKWMHQWMCTWNTCNCLISQNSKYWIIFSCNVSHKNLHKPVFIKIQKQNGKVIYVLQNGMNGIMYYTKVDFSVQTQLFGIDGILVSKTKWLLSSLREGWLLECTLIGSHHPLG